MVRQDIIGEPLTVQYRSLPAGCTLGWKSLPDRDLLFATGFPPDPPAARQPIDISREPRKFFRRVFKLCTLR
jgi:hypothetical protein